MLGDPADASSDPETSATYRSISRRQVMIVAKENGQIMRRILLTTLSLLAGAAACSGSEDPAAGPCGISDQRVEEIFEVEVIEGSVSTSVPVPAETPLAAAAADDLTYDECQWALGVDGERGTVVVSVTLVDTPEVAEAEVSRIVSSSIENGLVAERWDAVETAGFRGASGIIEVYAADSYLVTFERSADVDAHDQFVAEVLNGVSDR